MPGKENEKVLCVGRALRPPVVVGADLHASADLGVFGEMCRQYPTLCRYIRRGDCETDKGWLQVIPYVVFATDRYAFAYYRRYGGEKRLRGRMSFGVGGHINPRQETDVECPSYDVPTQILTAAFREIEEELGISAVVFRRDFSLRFVGWVHSDLTTVDSVHLGAVFVAVPRSVCDSSLVNPVRQSFAVLQSLTAACSDEISEPTIVDLQTGRCGGSDEVINVSQLETWSLNLWSSLLHTKDIAGPVYALRKYLLQPDIMPANPYVDT